MSEASRRSAPTKRRRSFLLFIHTSTHSYALDYAIQRRAAGHNPYTSSTWTQNTHPKKPIDLFGHSKFDSKSWNPAQMKKQRIFCANGNKLKVSRSTPNPQQNRICALDQNPTTIEMASNQNVKSWGQERRKENFNNRAESGQRMRTRIGLNLRESRTSPINNKIFDNPLSSLICSDIRGVGVR